MSTFGKKALNYWDYNSAEFSRFNKSPIDIQLKILEKWYPIGYTCRFIYPGTGTSDIIYQIKNYELKYNFYTVIVEPIKFEYRPLMLSGYNPLKLDVIDKQILKREYKLEKILKNPS